MWPNLQEITFTVENFIFCALNAYFCLTQFLATETPLNFEPAISL